MAYGFDRVSTEQQHGVLGLCVNPIIMTYQLGQLENVTSFNTTTIEIFEALFIIFLHIGRTLRYMIERDEQVLVPFSYLRISYKIFLFE